MSLTRAEAYCGPCGQIHSTPVNENCKRGTGRQLSNPFTEVEETDKIDMESMKKEISSVHVGPVTDSEDELSLADKIRELEAQKRQKERTARRKELQTELDRLTTDNPVPTVTRSPSRDRRRHRRSKRTSSTSSSDRTPSRERRRKSKWSLRRYTEDRKEVKKLNAYELIEASCSWFFDQEDLTTMKYCHFMKHIAFLAAKAKADKFLDCAHVHYDLAIRKLCVKQGFAAFTAGNSDLALKYYAFENLKPKRLGTGTKAPATRAFVKDGKRPCYDYNKVDGCTKSAGSCPYGHWCARCGSKAHKKSTCRND